MDDFGKEHACLGYHLKIWADRYGHILETKGGAVTDNYKKFVITSQYSPEQLFHDSETLLAIQRRFEVIHML